MNNKTKFFDSRLKWLLTALAVNIVLFIWLQTTSGHSSAVCSPTLASNLHIFFVVLMMGLTSSYWFVRFIFWPNGPKNQLSYKLGWIMGAFIGLFFAGVLYFGLGIIAWGTCF
ncbi:MAG: hypothetical protein V4702_00790 [Patescibacteria group bacterium]